MKSVRLYTDPLITVQQLDWSACVLTCATVYPLGFGVGAGTLGVRTGAGIGFGVGVVVGFGVGATVGAGYCSVCFTLPTGVVGVCESLTTGDTCCAAYDIVLVSGKKKK